MKRLWIFCVIMCATSTSAFSDPTAPDCVLPYWNWAQTGSIYHYYSEFTFKIGTQYDCNISDWDNWDGPANAEVYEGCDPDTCNGYELLFAKQAAGNVKTPSHAKRHPTYGAKTLKDGYITTSGKPYPPTTDLKLNNVPPPNAGNFYAFRRSTRYVKVEYPGGVVKYYKLFETRVSMGAGKKYQVTTVRTGIEITKPTGEDLIEIKEKDIDTAIEKISDGALLFNFGRKPFVVRVHKSAA